MACYRLHNALGFLHFVDSNAKLRNSILPSECIGVRRLVSTEYEETLRLRMNFRVTHEG
jgi:hypothetical protein